MNRRGLHVARRAPSATAALRPPEVAPAGIAAALATGAAILVGALAGARPALAVGVVGAVLVMALAFVAPVANLVLLLAVTAIVPYEVQNALAFGGGVGTPGIYAADVLLLGGLARAALVLLARPLDRQWRPAVVLVSAFLGVATLQALHGLRGGNQPADVAADLRAVLGFGTALIALPILAEPAARTRLLRGLVVVGLLLGLWGIAQWTLNLPLAASGDTGVRAGVSLTTAGRGQLQGGMFGFPLALLMALGALLCAPRASPAVRWLLAAVLALNAISLLLTFERTLWLATALGFGILVARAPHARRARVLVAGAVTLAALIAAMAIVAPGELRTAGQRFAAIGQYRSDASVRYRLLESRHVVERVQAHPLAGSGLGARILWGIPYAQVPPRFQTYSHDGYLWLAWKLGLPAAALLLVILALAIASRAPPAERDPLRAVRAGAQAGLVAMLVVGIAFPTFGAAPVTPVLGVLIAVCATGRAPAFGARRPSAAHRGRALVR